MEKTAVDRLRLMETLEESEWRTLTDRRREQTADLIDAERLHCRRVQDE